ncbi:DegT/DnrJ/EryC1/StrS family aminotransferase [Streptomyces gobiensis]|uniref:DegT/DnrJ/EryC1/StrS family aminotransferase n=1 Tax=Streptomyces gobiensis TaxID=2875706 RepID=UPI003BB044B6
MAELEELMSDRLGRQCLYVPSCRFALYLALRHWCPHGGKILMSPVNDDVILFVTLAAGMRPVQAPVSTADGNIDPDAVPESVWPQLAAVLTTNLYGQPDRVAELRTRCDLLGIPLIEDAAHAIGTAIAGRRVGTFGVASAFSLSKHGAAKAGGFLTFEDPAKRVELSSLREELLLGRRISGELLHAVRPAAEATVRGLRLTRLAWRTVRVLGMDERYAQIRMPLRPDELRAALARSTQPPGPPDRLCPPGLDALDSWIRVDMHGYRQRQGPAQLRRIHHRLDRIEERMAARRAGTRLLARSPWAPDSLRLSALRPELAQPLFRVPLMVADRDAMIDQLARHHITTGYLYDAPLDTYAGAEFTELSPSPEQAAWFARHALPVDPLQALRVIRLLTEAGARAAPDPPPRLAAPRLRNLQP